MPAYVIYARKSSESEEQQILSIESQIKELEILVQKQKLEIAKIYSESKSAKGLGRPVFNEMMSEIYGKKIKGILCWKLDRLARNPVDGSSLVWALEEKKIEEIVTPSRTFYNNSNDKFWMQLEFGMAKKYVDDLSDNVKRGLKAKIEKGWLPGVAPLGYVNDKFGEKGNRKIFKDPERFKLVKKMWELMLSGQYKPPQILEIANNQWDFRTRRTKRQGGKPLSRSGIYRIFTNPFYCGLIEHKGVLYQGSHQPMITPEQFDRVQILLGRKGKPRPKRHSFTFTGLIRCAECGAMVTAELKKKMIRSTGELRFYTYYHCTKRKNPFCTQKSIGEKELEEQIDSFLSRIQIPEEYKNWAIKYLHKLKTKEEKDNEEIERNHQKALENVQKQLDNLIALKISPQNADECFLTDEEFARQKNRLVKEKARLEDLLRQTGNKEEEVLELTERTFNFACYSRIWFEKGDQETKRKVFSSLGSNYVLKDKILQFEAKKPLSLIEARVNGLKVNDGRLEPKKVSLDKEKKEIFEPSFSTWCPLVDDVRTFFRGQGEKIILPNFFK